MSAFVEDYSAPPSVAHYMLRAFRRFPRWKRDKGFPDLRTNWHNVRFAADDLRDIGRMMGGDDPEGAERHSILVPQVTGFRLLMVTLTHPAWPLPIWRALQVRNRLRLHRPVRSGDDFAFYTEVSGWRVLEKGVEVDLHATLLQGESCVWEGVTTFYYRGRFGTPAEHGAARGAAGAAPLVDDRRARVEAWRAADCGRWRFARLTGDYNGIHLSDWYARRFGFPAAFAHPQRIAGQCLAHLPIPGPVPQQLDLWIRGPVRYGAELRQSMVPHADGDGQDFALRLAGDPRPALIGSWTRNENAGLHPSKSLGAGPADG